MARSCKNKPHIEDIAFDRPKHGVRAVIRQHHDSLTKATNRASGLPNQRSYIWSIWEAIKRDQDLLHKLNV